MLLQIDKFLKYDVGNSKTSIMRTDIIKGVKQTCIAEEFLQVHFRNGEVKSYTIDEKDKIKDVAGEWNDYKISAIWLLNDKGKTLRKLL